MLIIHLQCNTASQFPCFPNFIILVIVATVLFYCGFSNVFGLNSASSRCSCLPGYEVVSPVWLYGRIADAFLLLICLCYFQLIYSYSPWQRNSLEVLRLANSACVWVSPPPRHHLSWLEAREHSCRHARVSQSKCMSWGRVADTPPPSTVLSGSLYHSLAMLCSILVC